MTNIVQLDELRATLARADATLADAILPRGSGDGTSGGMEVRLGKLETAVEGLRHAQNILLGAVGAGFAVVIALSVYALTRIDGIEQRLVTKLDTLGSNIATLSERSAKIEAKLEAPTPPPMKPKP